MGSADRWSYVAGEKGRNRVRAFERSNSSNLYLEFSDRDPETGEWRRRRISAQTSDKAEAKAKADELAAKWAEGRTTEEDPPEEITVSTLFDRFLTHRTPQVGEREQKQHSRVCEAFQRFVGPTTSVADLKRSHWDAFATERRRGEIDARGRQVSDEDSQRPVSGRTVERDQKTLRAALNWGVDEGLIEENPFDGYPYAETTEPDPPMVPEDRYEAMLDVAGEVDWRFWLALVVAHETGRRIGAIRQLRWSDVDLENHRIHWRGDTDKIGVESRVPISERATRALQTVYAEREIREGGWVFPAPESPSEPCSRYLMRDWWHRAEELAGLEHIDGLGWHGLRRKFANDLRDEPLRDLCDLGGWKTEDVLLKRYLKRDEESMRASLERRRTG